MESPRYVVRISCKNKDDGTLLNGTGFMVDKEGHVVTCWHIVSQADEITVHLPFTKPWKYRVCEKLEIEDLVLLESIVPPSIATPKASLHPDWWSDSEVDDVVVVWGFSASEHYTAAQRFVCTISGFSENHGRIGLNGDVNPGDSGAPVVNTNGEVIGITQVKDANRNGQAMAIPISLLFKIFKLDTTPESFTSLTISAQKNSSHQIKPPYELRLPVTRLFTGREFELCTLENSLLKSKRSNKICVISGPSGFGKSVLASHFASLYRDKFQDGVVGLRVEGKDLNSIVRDLARIYGMKINSNDERDSTLFMKELFSQRNALIIFDNVENKDISSLLDLGENCAIILTTHDRLLSNLLEIPADCMIDLSPLPDASSLELLKNSIGDERVEKDPKCALNIIKLVGNMPLALKIICANLQMQPMRSLSSFEKSLDEEKSRLSKLKISGDEDLNVKASLSLCLKHLKDEDTKKFFACLSVCATDGFSINAAIAASGCDEDRAIDHLIYLLRFSLLEAQSDSEKYTMHPLTLLFARDLAHQLEVFEDATKRHAHFYINYLKNDTKEICNALSVSENIDDILLAGKWMSNQEEYDSQFLFRLFLIFNNFGRWKQAIDLISALLPRAETLGNWSDVVQLRVQQATYLLMSGEITKAEKALNPIPPLLEKVQQQVIRQRLEIGFFNILGTVFKKQGQLTKAEMMIRKSLEIAQDLDYTTSQSVIVNNPGDFQFREFWDIAENLDDKKFQTIVLTSLGCILRDRGRLEEAEKVLRESLDIIIKVDDKRAQSFVLNSLGSVLQKQGEFIEAELVLRESLDLSESLEDKRSQSIALNSLGSVLRKQGKFNEAEKVLRKSLDIAGILDDEKSQSIVLNSLGSVLRRQGEFNEAEKLLRKSLDIAIKLDDKIVKLISMNSLGAILRDQERFEEAEKILRESLGIAQKMEDKKNESIILNNLKIVLLKQGKLEDEGKTRGKICDRTEVIKNDSVINVGTVTKLIKHQKGYKYGFICPDEGKENIYFREEFIDPETFNNLKISSRVEFGVKKGSLGPQATFMRMIDGFDPES